MFKENLDKYTVYHAKNGTTVAVAHFAKQNVRGYARRHPGDAVDEKIGDNIAILRCAKKINVKRTRNAEKKLAAAKLALEAAQEHVDAMTTYVQECYAEKDEIAAEMDKAGINR